MRTPDNYTQDERLDPKKYICDRCLKAVERSTVVSMAGGFFWCPHCSEQHDKEEYPERDDCATCGNINDRQELLAALDYADFSWRLNQ